MKKVFIIALLSLSIVSNIYAVNGMSQSKHKLLEKLVSGGNIKQANKLLQDTKLGTYEYRIMVDNAYEKKKIDLFKFLLKDSIIKLDKSDYSTHFLNVSKDENIALMDYIYDDKLVAKWDLCKSAEVAVRKDNVEMLLHLLNTKKYNKDKKVITCQKLLFDSKEKTTQILIDNGADIEVEQYTTTPIGASFGKKTAILIRARANLHVEDGDGNLPIHRACKAAWRETKKAAKNRMISVQTFLDAGIDINIKTYNGNTPLMIASQSNDLEIVKLLVSKGANIDSENRYYERAIDFAIAEDSLDTAKYLYNLGARLSKKSYDKSIINRAVSNNAKKVTKYFLDIEKDKQDNVTSFYGMTALTEYLSKYSDLDMVKILIEHGYDVNAQSKSSGITPLHLAWSLDIAKYLVEHGAVMKKDRYGKTPIDKAIKENNKKLIEYYSTLQPKVKGQK